MRHAALPSLLLLAAPALLAQTFAIEGNCRDGQPHGNYELRGPGGQVRVVGAFNKGKRTGSFLFWSSTGARVAHLPYDDDVLSGTLALWYTPPDGKGEPAPKLEATYVHGRLSGVKRSWHPNGRVRSEFRYDQGMLIEARAFTATGKPLPEAEARTAAARDLTADDQHYASLDAIVRTHLPRCPLAGERRDKG